MSKPDFKKYDANFDAWWQEVLDCGVCDTKTLPTDDLVKQFDPFGSFDSGQSALYFAKTLDQNINKR